MLLIRNFLNFPTFLTVNLKHSSSDADEFLNPYLGLEYANKERVRNDLGYIYPETAGKCHNKKL